MVVVRFCGACQQNPGTLAVGGVLETDSGVFRLSELAGSGSNHVADYRALIGALRLAHDKGVTQIEVQGHSKLVMKQLSGEWKANDAKLLSLFKEAVELLGRFQTVKLMPITRHKNNDAEMLARDALGSTQSPPASVSALEQSESNDVRLIPHRGIGFSVISGGVLYAVNLAPLSCSCGQFEADRPCKHVQLIMSRIHKA